MAILIGDATNNTFTGDPTGVAENDTLQGRGGDDLLLALGGDDNLNGGRGFLDRLFGDDGNDILTDPDGVNGAHGGSGDDRLRITFVPEWDNNTNPSDEPRSDGKITGGFGNDVITLTMNHDGFFINLKGDLPSPINDPQDGNDRITLQGLYATSLVD